MFSKFRQERMEAIAQEINKYHIVALQEVHTPCVKHCIHTNLQVWSKDDFEAMRKIATELSYSHMFYR